MALLVVKTKYGVVRGIPAEKNKEHSVFRGIPYVRPPVGGLRFAVQEEPDGCKLEQIVLTAEEQRALGLIAQQALHPELFFVRCYIASMLLRHKFIQFQYFYDGIHFILQFVNVMLDFFMGDCHIKPQILQFLFSAALF